MGIRVNDLVRLKDNRIGTVKFFGRVRFAKGEWYGVSLDNPFSGKCDGEFKGKRYFKCPKNKGIFVKKDKISEVVKKLSRTCSVTRDYADKIQETPGMGSVNSSRSISPDIVGEMQASMAMELKLPMFDVGIRVCCGERVGTVRFVGELQFNPRKLYLGVELDPSFKGKNDGSAKGKRYFSCAPGQGIFWKPETTNHYHDNDRSPSARLNNEHLFAKNKMKNEYLRISADKGSTGNDKVNDSSRGQLREKSKRRSPKKSKRRSPKKSPCKERPSTRSTIPQNSTLPKITQETEVQLALEKQVTEMKSVLEKAQEEKKSQLKTYNLKLQEAEKQIKQSKEIAFQKISNLEKTLEDRENENDLVEKARVLAEKKVTELEGKLSDAKEQIRLERETIRNQQKLFLSEKKKIHEEIELLEARKADLEEGHKRLERKLEIKDVELNEFRSSLVLAQGQLKEINEEMTVKDKMVLELKQIQEELKVVKENLKSEAQKRIEEEKRSTFWRRKSEKHFEELMVKRRDSISMEKELSNKLEKLKLDRNGDDTLFVKKGDREFIEKTSVDEKQSPWEGVLLSSHVSIKSQDHVKSIPVLADNSLPKTGDAKCAHNSTISRDSASRAKTYSDSPIDSFSMRMDSTESKIENGLPSKEWIISPKSSLTPVSPNGIEVSLPSERSPLRLRSDSETEFSDQLFDLGKRTGISSPHNSERHNYALMQNSPNNQLNNTGPTSPSTVSSSSFENILSPGHESCKGFLSDDSELMESAQIALSDTSSEEPSSYVHEQAVSPQNWNTEIDNNKHALDSNSLWSDIVDLDKDELIHTNTRTVKPRGSDLNELELFDFEEEWRQASPGKNSVQTSSYDLSNQHSKVKSTVVSKLKLGVDSKICGHGTKCSAYHTMYYSGNKISKPSSIMIPPIAISPASSFDPQAKLKQQLGVEFTKLEAKIRGIQEWNRKITYDICSLSNNPSNFDQIFEISEPARTEKIQKRLMQVYQVKEEHNSLTESHEELVSCYFTDRIMELNAIIKNCEQDLNKTRKDLKNQIILSAFHFKRNIAKFICDYWWQSKTVRRDLNFTQRKLDSSIPYQTVLAKAALDDFRREETRLSELKARVIYLGKMGDYIGKMKNSEAKDCLRDSKDLEAIHQSLSTEVSKRKIELNAMFDVRELCSQMEKGDDLCEESNFEVVKWSDFKIRELRHTRRTSGPKELLADLDKINLLADLEPSERLEFFSDIKEKSVIL